MKQANLGLSVEQLLERQGWLQTRAADAIDRLNLTDILSDAGRPVVVGSAELGLMVWPDLDIEVVSPEPPAIGPILRVLERLITDAGMTKVSFGDTRNDANPQVPKGFYLGPDVEIDGMMWQVDIWFMDEANHQHRRQLVESIQSRLDDQAIQAILAIKQVAAASDLYHRGVSSVDIYQAVLDHDVVDIDGFDAYLSQSGRSL